MRIWIMFPLNQAIILHVGEGNFKFFFFKTQLFYIADIQSKSHVFCLLHRFPCSLFHLGVFYETVN